MGRVPWLNWLPGPGGYPVVAGFEGSQPDPPRAYRQKERISTMFGLGNKFGGARRAAPVEPTSQVDSTATVQGAQTALVAKQQKEMHRVTMRARVEALTADVDTARADLARATRDEGLALYQERDSSTEALAAQQAGHRVAALEAALAIAIQKEDEAQAQLELAERDLVDAQREEVQNRLVVLADEGEELFIRIKLFRAELISELEALRELGGHSEKFGYGSNEIRLHFDHFMAMANRPASHADADSGAFQKYPSWSYCVQVVCGKRDAGG